MGEQSVNDNRPIDEDGKPVSDRVLNTMITARSYLDALTPHQRGFVMCWYCPACHEFIGPGKKFTCGKHTENA